MVCDYDHAAVQQRQELGGKQLNFQRNKCLRKKFSIGLTEEKAITYVAFVV